MRHSIAAFFLVLTASASFAQGGLEFPSLRARILEQQFPKFDKTNVTLTSLRKYRTELEYFRDEVLEGYNKAVKEYVAELGEYDDARSVNDHPDTFCKPSARRFIPTLARARTSYKTPRTAN